MDSLEALADREHQHAAKSSERLDALEKFVGEKREEFDAYGKRIAEAFTEKEQIEGELRQAKKETEEHLARERREREQMEADLVKARAEHERTLQREREQHASAVREENQAQEKEVRDAKREHETRMRDERRQLESRLNEERQLLDTMIKEEREQHEIALGTERKKFRATAEAESKKHAEELKGHVDSKAAAELELAQVQLALQEKEMLEDELRRQLDKLTSGKQDGLAELGAQLEDKDQELARQRELEAEVRGEAAVVESELYDRIEVLQDNLRQARESAVEASDAQRRVAAELDNREGSIRELSSALDVERRAGRDAELLHREQTLEFPGPVKRSNLDPEEQAKLQRAVTFSLKVMASLVAGSIEEDSQEEVMKRARIALGVARDLVDKL